MTRFPFIARTTKPRQQPAYHPQPEVLEGRRLLASIVARVDASAFWEINSYTGAGFHLLWPSSSDGGGYQVDPNGRVVPYEAVAGIGQSYYASGIDVTYSSSQDAEASATLLEPTKGQATVFAHVENTRSGPTNVGF